MPRQTTQPGRRRLIRAAQAADGRGRRLRPASLLLEGRRIVAAGTPAEVGAPADVEIEARPDAVILPGLVNAHCHLDLSHVAPFPCEGGFAAWIARIRRLRRTDAAGIAASARRGAALSRAGGTALVGDVAGAAAGRACLVPLETLGAAGMAGVSYLEVFGLGAGEPEAVAALRAAVAAAGPGRGAMRSGIQPHAPYSCGRSVYAAALATGLPLATHLAETPEEIEFTLHGRGAIAEFLAGLELWGPGCEPFGRHPLDHLAEILAARPVLAAHVNYCEPRHLELLAAWRTTVVFCPRAASYFGHRGHAWRRMRSAGVAVALGTDALPCLDTPDRISIIDEMRLLHRRDGAEPMALLEMATVAGATALGADPSPCTLDAGASAGLIALPCDPADPAEPLVQALRRDDAPQWVLEPDGAAAP